MSAAAIPRLSVEEYFALDRDAELKSEYHDGVLYPLCAVSVEHASLGVMLALRVQIRLLGGLCRAMMAPLRVRVSRTKYVYPDLMVVCGKPILTDENADTITNPKVVIEVLSPSTTDYDYGTKFGLYRSLPSLEEYVLVAQDRQRIEVFRRMDNQEWRLSRYDGAETVLPIESLNISIPLGEIYEGIVDDAPVVEV